MRSTKVTVVGLAMSGLLFSTAACTSADTTYCDSDHPDCGEGKTCDFSTLTCVDDVSTDGSAAYDGAEGDSSRGGGDAGGGREGGAPDAALVENGEACVAGEDCKSGVCSTDEMVCCDRQCNGVCESCKGKSACTPKPKGTSCGAGPKCVDGSSGSTLTTHACDGSSGSCQKSTTSCGAYKCAGSTSCATKCTSNTGCASGVCDLDEAKNTCVAASKICYVDDSCTGTGSGTRSDPYCDHKACVSKKAAYIAFFPGTYSTFSVSFDTQLIGLGQKPVLSTNWLDLTASSLKFTQPTVVMEAGLSGVLVSGAVTVVLRGLQLKEKSSGLNGPLVGSQTQGAELVLRNVFFSQTTSASGIDMTYGKLTMRNVFVFGAGAYGVRSESTTLDVQDVLITSKINGFRLESKPASFARLMIYNCGAAGLLAYNATVTADRVSVLNSAGAGLDLENGTTGRITNLLATDNSKEAVKLSAGSTLAIANATVIDNNSTGSQLSCDTSATTNIYNSIVWSYSGSSSYSGQCAFQYSTVRGGAPGSGNLSSDPKFVAPSASQPDYRLQSGSGAIDSGKNTALTNPPKLDLAGKTRIVKKTASTATIDMGAYEAQ